MLQWANRKSDLPVSTLVQLRRKDASHISGNPVPDIHLAEVTKVVLPYQEFGRFPHALQNARPERKGIAKYQCARLRANKRRHAHTQKKELCIREDAK